jgi:hypothetical protein
LVRTDVSNNLVSATLTGTTDQVIVTDNSTNYSLSLPQSIATTSVPTFQSAIINDGISRGFAMYDTNSRLTYLSLAGADGNIPISAANGLVYSAQLTGTTNQVIVTPGAGAITLSLPQSIHTNATPTFKGMSLTTTGLGTTTVTASSSMSATSLALTNTSSQLRLGGFGTHTVCDFPTPLISSTLTFPNVTTTIVGRDTTDTLTNKTLTSPTLNSPLLNNLVITGGTLINCFLNRIINTGTLSLPSSSDTLIGKYTTDTLTNKTLTTPTIASIVNTGLLSLPAGPDTLVGRNTTDTLTNKTLTSPILTNVTLTNATLITPRIFNTGTITLPTLSDTLVGRSTTDTLTNKTLTSATLVTPLITNLSLSGSTLLGCYFDKLINTGTITLPTISDTMVTRTTTDTLTNKTLTTPTITSLYGGGGLLTMPRATDTLATVSSAQFLQSKGFEDSNYFTLHTNHNQKIYLLATNGANNISECIQSNATTSGVIHVLPDSSVLNSFIMDTVASGSQTINNALTCFRVTLTGWLKLPSSGATGTTTFDYYESYTGSSMVASGPFTVAPSFNVHITRIGDTVICELPAISVNTCNTSTFFTITALPSRFFPARGNNQYPMNVFNNNVNVIGYCQIDTSGVIKIFAGVGPTAFTAGNFIATYITTITWKTT